MWGGNTDGVYWERSDNHWVMSKGQGVVLARAWIVGKAAMVSHPGTLMVGEDGADKYSLFGEMQVTAPIVEVVYEGEDTE